ncbi:hypothetical protein E3N88_26863 [Mikania micrantha]|uniref:Bifunctional inhibitor/plant lipid transfer protein/seed storage helical domain-containing protein n=1 Tax=Mikania micrantha TaxID=192012 RepID=A0A5N6MY06_9ASTR|nr:hypothetical protein E3N88_26863 [Mikania micrantha]
MVMVLLAVASAAPIAAPNAAQCKKERRLGINACKSVLYGRLPSPSCCQRIRVSHLKCICSVITPKLAALINVFRYHRNDEDGRRNCDLCHDVGSKYECLGEYV